MRFFLYKSDGVAYIGTLVFTVNYFSTLLSTPEKTCKGDDCCPPTINKLLQRFYKERGKIKKTKQKKNTPKNLYLLLFFTVTFVIYEIFFSSTLTQLNLPLR